MSTYIFAGIVVLIFASLIISAVSYSRQQAYKAKKKKLFSLKTRSDEILNYLRLLLQIDDDYRIIHFLQKQLVQLTRTAKGIAPEDPQWSRLLTTYEQSLSQYASGTRSNPIECYVSSDSELSTLQMQLLQVSKHLDVCRNRGLLDTQTHEAMLAHIQRLKLDLDVNSHVYQAQQHGTEGDIVLYQLHLKQARDALSKSKLNISDKTGRVKQLTEMINHAKRTNRMFDAPLPNSDTGAANGETEPPLPDEEATTP